MSPFWVTAAIVVTTYAVTGSLAWRTGLKFLDALATREERRTK